MIHVFKEEGKFEVWSDCDEDICTGRCIGFGDDKAKALADARREIVHDLAEIDRILREGE